jgi:N,N'-diacetyl-8-epilegionaminate cytidylyltransferase
MRMQAFIFARGGSKGLPRKNVLPFNGKPLIAHAIECALRCPSLGSVIVSTDDAEIADIARAHGANVPFMRPDDLASDAASEWLAWRHAIEWVQVNQAPFDVMVSLPTTAPLRAVVDVERCVDVLREDSAADAVACVTEAQRSPYFNMVRVEPDGAAALIIPPASAVWRRQDAPDVYDMTTVAYAARVPFVLQSQGLFAGRLRVVDVPRERSLDIDTSLDFTIAESIVKAGLAMEAVCAS